MADRQKTLALIKEIKKHGDVALEQLDSILEQGPEAGLHIYDLDLRAALEHDFGPGYRERVENMESAALEAIVTSGMFHKMVQRQIRFGLMENPREQYKLLSLVPSETKGECEGNYRDWGVFSDFRVQKLSELQKAPLYGIATDYLDHPEGAMYGNALAWTREAMCKDPNGFIQTQVPKLVDAHQFEIELALIDTLIGYEYTYDRSGTEYDVYYDDGTVFTDGTSGPWQNSLPLAIECPSSFDPLKDLWRNMTDLVHGRPIEWNETNMQVLTSLEQASALRKILKSTEVREDVTCGDSTFKYVMTPQVANDLDFEPVGYRRMVDKIVERYAITEAQAQQWMWFGNIADFMGLVYQIRPRAMRVPIGSEEYRRRIVAMYTTESKWYSYVKDPQKGVLVTDVDSGS